MLAFSREGPDLKMSLYASTVPCESSDFTSFVEHKVVKVEDIMTRSN